MNKLQAIEALMRLKNVAPVHFANPNLLTSKWWTVSKLRNRAVHDPTYWHEELKKVLIVQIQSVKGGTAQFDATEFDYDFYVNLLGQINKFQREFTQFRDLLMAAIEGLP